MVAWRMRATVTSVRQYLHLPKVATRKKPLEDEEEWTQTEVPNLRRISALTTFPGWKFRPGRSMMVAWEVRGGGAVARGRRSSLEMPRSPYFSSSSMVDRWNWTLLMILHLYFFTIKIQFGPKSGSRRKREHKTIRWSQVHCTMCSPGPSLSNSQFPSYKYI